MLLIGARILEYRKAANMSQEEFAAKIGVSRQAVSKWELDKAYPDLDKLVDICEMFHISIDELICGKSEFVSEKSDTQDEEDHTGKKQDFQSVNVTSAGNLRSRFGKIRLGICALFSGMLFVFCCIVFITVLLQNAWNKDNTIENARVERVYQQYTKADICFYDDNSRKVLKTVWLDTDGIRDGDYIECYTDDEQQQIFVDYYIPTIVVPGILMVLFLCIFILICIGIYRLHKENKWSVLIEEEFEQERQALDA